MPPSKRERRKISKALRRSEGRSIISIPSSSFSPAKGTGQARKGGVTASADPTVGQGQLKHTGSRNSSTARSLSETFASLAVQRPPPAPETNESPLDNAATVPSVAPYRSLFGGPCPDPFVNSSEQTAPEKDDMDQMPPHQSLDSGQRATENSPQSMSVHRRVLPTSKTGSPQDRRSSSPNRQSAFDDLYDTSPYTSDVSSSAPDDFTSLAQSMDGIMEDLSAVSLASGDVGDNIIRVTIPYARSEASSSPTPSKSSIRPPVEHTGLPPYKLPATAQTLNQDAPCRTEAESDSLSQGTTLIDRGYFDDVASANEVRIPGTNRIQLPQLHRTFAAMGGRPLPSVPAAGVVQHNFINHRPDLPLSFDTRSNHYWFDKPARLSSAFGQHSNTSLRAPHNRYHNRQPDPVFLPRSYLAHRELPLTNRTDRYDLSRHETHWETQRRMRHPDWAQDARAHNRSLASIHPALRYAAREQDVRGYIMGIPKPARSDASIRMMSEYTQRFYGCSLDAARDLRPTATAPGLVDVSNISARWLPELRSRIGKCIIFGLGSAQIEEAGSILRVITRQWRDLLAGSEGFLVGRGRAGLEGHQVVWGEMDSMGHVNNVTYIRYAESARINWAQNFAKYHDPTHKKQWEELWTPKGDGLILRSIKTDFKFPMSWPDRISVYHKLRSPPADTSESFILDVLILSERHQRAAARCVEDIVVYDYRRGQKVPLRPFMVAQLEKTWDAQEAAKKENRAKVGELLARVRRLEMDSWDREGALEDTGSR
ncbi:MAG: hypothetical protein Q9197_000107 [Variospora fuerteventurae]